MKAGKMRIGRLGALALAAAILLAGLAWLQPVREQVSVPAWSGAVLDLTRKLTNRAQPSGEEVSRMLIPVGRTVGIKLFSDGVLVVGLEDSDPETNGPCPARQLGLKAGDVITHINGQEVDTIEEVQAMVKQMPGTTVTMRVNRGDMQLQLSGQADWSGPYSTQLGAWVRDSMAGIGTVTFCDPATGMFAALGHGINDVDTAQLMPLESGSILYSSVVDVKKGLSGAPGELQGTFDLDRDLGDLYANTRAGIFGTLTDRTDLGGAQALEVASPSQVKQGSAVILSNVAGDEVKEYQVEITHIYSGSDTRNLMLKVTDPELLSITGGIVQGMSGSPIIQDGKLVGAVTHVLVNDPTKGYGIFIENMLEAAG